MKTSTLSVLLCAVMFLAAADGYRVMRHCSPGWFLSCGRCYVYVRSYLTWTAAEKNCLRLGAHLASVHSIFEQRRIQRVILRYSHGYPNTWLGASDCQTEGTWLWTDGTPFNYRYYGGFNNQGHRQHCLQMNYGARRYWDDVECYQRRPSVCVKKAHKKFIGKTA